MYIVTQIKTSAIILAVAMLFSLPSCKSKGETSKMISEDKVSMQLEQPLFNGVSLEKLGLSVILPSNSGIKDPNIIGDNSEYSAVEAYSNGAHTSVVLNYVDSIISVSSHEVLLLQAFNIKNANIEKATFNIENTNFKTKQYSYSDVADHILQIKDGIMVIDVSFASEIDFRAEMINYITEKSNTETYNIAADEEKMKEGDFIYADATNIYKYDWMLPAFDYVTEHIREMISTS